MKKKIHRPIGPISAQPPANAKPYESPFEPPQAQPYSSPVSGEVEKLAIKPRVLK